MYLIYNIDEMVFAYMLKVMAMNNTFYKKKDTMFNESISNMSYLQVISFNKIIKAVEMK
jgi:hypothetical protein